jgi:hypothetical protein
MRERRRVQRETVQRAVFIRGLILRDGEGELPCTLLDISDLGARLRVANVGELPDRFTLALTQRGVPRRECRLIWRGENEVGVSFEANRKGEDRELVSGSTLGDALDVFGRRS